MVSYPVRTPRLYWAVIALLCGGAGLVAYLLGPLLFTFDPDPRHLVVLIFAWVCVLLPALYFLTTGEYRAGKRGVITLSRDHVELPDTRGRPLRLPVASLTVALTDVKVRVRVAGIPVGTVPRGTVLDFRAGDVRRRISTLTLTRAGHAESLLDDVARVLRGEAPLGPYRPGPPAPEPEPEKQEERDRYDEALDAELDRLR
jgi:hypothetical protein